MIYKALMDPDSTKFGITWRAKRLSEAHTRSVWSAPKSGRIIRPVLKHTMLNVDPMTLPNL